MRPEQGTHPEFYNNYIPKAKGENVMDAFSLNLMEIKSVLSEISPTKENFAYAPGKWTIKQIVNHLIDTERIFAYRALRFARKDPQQPLPFEEDHYAANADVSGRSLNDLMEELEHVRMANIYILKNFSKETLMLSGKTTMGNATVLSIGYTICGHAAHHLNVIKEKYL